MNNKLYKVIYDPEQRAAAISPSPYLKILTPQEALIKLQNRRNRLIRKLEQCERAIVHGKVERKQATQTTRDLILEIELCEHCMTCIREYDLPQLRTAKKQWVRSKLQRRYPNGFQPQPSAFELTLIHHTRNANWAATWQRSL